MTDQYTSLSLATLKEIAAGVNQTLAVFHRHHPPLASAEEEVLVMLQKLQLQIQEQIDRHPENRR